MSEQNELSCLDDHEGDCVGPVEMRHPLSESGRPFPRCNGHWNRRLRKQDEINRRYAPFSDVPPDGFDPTYAGERWEDDH